MLKTGLLVLGNIAIAGNLIYQGRKDIDKRASFYTTAAISLVHGAVQVYAQKKDLDLFNRWYIRPLGNSLVAKILS